MEDDELLALTVDEEGRIDAVIARLAPELSRSRAAALVKEGRVTVGGVAVTRVSHRVAIGEAVAIDVPPPAPSEAVPEDLPLAIVYEDDDLVVIDKAAGMVVHPAVGHARGTLVNALLFHVGGLSGIGGVERPGIVHRLDRGTSGLIVVAKHDLAHRALSEQFAAHTAGRTYYALCLGVPDDARGTVRSRLARHPTDRVRWASTATGGKAAITHWERVAVRGEISLIRCRLETGRTHQVRVHLTEQGWPLVGDPLYKRRDRRLPAALRDLVACDRPLLHAAELALDHPRTGARCVFHAPFPDDFRAALAALALDQGAQVGSAAGS